MHRSSLLARVLTTLIAIVLVPTALALLSVGGTVIVMTNFAYGTGDQLTLVGPILLQLLGMVLLVLVVVTGIWSSAGLIVSGLLGLVATIMLLFPSFMFATSRFIPREWSDAAVYGVPATVLIALGAMGVVLAIVRRSPLPSSAVATVLAVLGAPVLLAVGGWALVWGINEGTLAMLRTAQTDINPVAALVTVVGLALIFAGIAVARWSPFALALPALVLLVASIAQIVAPTLVIPALMLLPRGMNVILTMLLLYGAGGAAGLLYLTFTAVLLRVRQQARLVPPESSPGGFTAAPALPYPPQYDPSQPAPIPPARPYGP